MDDEMGRERTDLQSIEANSQCAGRHSFDRPKDMRKDNRDSGTILILAPMIMIITLVLASIVIDLNAIYSAKTALQDHLQALASAAANQISSQNLYFNGEVTIDQSRAYSLISSQIGTGVGVLSIRDYQIQSTSDSICIAADATLPLPALSPIIDAIVSPTVRATAIAVTPSPISPPLTGSICLQ